MQKSKVSLEPQLNTIENCNSTDKGRFIQEASIDIIICDPPLFKNQNDKQLNNWNMENDYYSWFRIFMNIASSRLRKTGIFYLIGDVEDLCELHPIIMEFDFQLSMTYYFTKNRKMSVGKKKDNTRTTKVIECVFVFTRNFQKEVKKILKLHQAKSKLSSREINLQLSGNGNGGGYWSLYCGENSRNLIPTEEHWNKLRHIFEIDVDYNDINTQFRAYEGINFWEDISYEEDKFLNGSNRPVNLFERLLQMNRKEPQDIMVWDPFCGYGNSTLACRKMGINYFAHEFDVKTYYKAMINTGNSLKFSKPVLLSVPQLQVTN